MSANRNEQLQDAAILTRAIENIFRKLIRFLVGRLSLVKLQEMIRFIYVDEAERYLRLEAPARDIPLTRLALLTGLDTRTLAKVRNSEGFGKPLHQEQRFLKTMTPESCVLDIWTSHPEFVKSITGKPKIIRLSGKGPTFEKLVKAAISSRGITSQSILQRLVANREVSLDEESGSLELLEISHAPYKAGNEWGALEAGLLHTGSLLDTVFHNFQAIKNNEKTFYQRGSWTHRLNPGRKAEFEERIRAFLLESDDSARKIMGEFEESVANDNQITAGISMFYFEDV